MRVLLLKQVFDAISMPVKSYYIAQKYESLIYTELVEWIMFSYCLNKIKLGFV